MWVINDHPDSVDAAKATGYQVLLFGVFLLKMLRWKDFHVIYG